jgi:hypothetical protein
MLHSSTITNRQSLKTDMLDFIPLTNEKHERCEKLNTTESIKCPALQYIHGVSRFH